MVGDIIAQVRLSYVDLALKAMLYLIQENSNRRNEYVREFGTN